MPSIGSLAVVLTALQSENEAQGRQTIAEKFPSHVLSLSGRKSALFPAWIARRKSENRHPPFSSDLAPSGFWLFEQMKDQLKGQTFIIEKDLLSKANEILQDVGESTLEFVFDE
jgi:hypothetical protein